MRWSLVPFVAALGVVVAACTGPTTKRAPINEELARQEAEKQRDLALAQWIEDQNRLANISHRLLIGSIELCGERLRPMIGLTLLSAPDVEEDFMAASARYNDGSEAIHVIGVMDDSAARAAGVAVGDRLVGVGDWVAPEGKGALAEAFTALGEVAAIDQEMTVTLTAADAEREAVIVPDAGCDYDVLLRNEDAVNAFADGDSVIVTRGMMRFVEDDTELATVVAHEIAHNVMGHLDLKKANVMVGAGVGFLLDVVAATFGVPTQGSLSRAGSEIAGGAFTQDFEAEADYVGLYIMAMSGMDVGETPNFWRRMAVANPASISGNHSATHPPTAERFIALENTVAEIRGKQVTGQPILPEFHEAD